MITARRMIMLLHDHDHVPSDAERGGDAIPKMRWNGDRKIALPSGPARGPRPIPAERGPPAAQSAIDEFLARASRSLRVCGARAEKAPSSRRREVSGCAASR